MNATHLGYFNNVEDINYLKDKNVEAIFSYKENDLGHFYRTGDVIEFNDFDNAEFSKYGYFIIVKSNSFIDLYLVDTEYIDKIAIWWTNATFTEIGNITNYNINDFITDDNKDNYLDYTSDYVEACDKYWHNLPFVDKLKIYLQNNP